VYLYLSFYSKYGHAVIGLMYWGDVVMVDKKKKEIAIDKGSNDTCVIQMKYINDSGQECVEEKTVIESQGSFILGGRLVRVNSL
jgi:hypothetical protein